MMLLNSNQNNHEAIDSAIKVKKYISLLRVNYCWCNHEFDFLKIYSTLVNWYQLKKNNQINKRLVSIFTKRTKLRAYQKLTNFDLYTHNKKIK